MKNWIYLDGYKKQCPVCAQMIEHKIAPKRCPNCGEKMVGFCTLFPPNNHPQKKVK